MITWILAYGIYVIDCLGFIIYVLLHILGQLLVQFAALLSCHYSNSLLAVVCAWRWQINDDDDDDDDDARRDCTAASVIKALYNAS